MREKWSAEAAWDWYRARPWPRGCNFISSNSVNRFDWFQQYDHEAKREATDRELALLAETGFNSIRIIMDFAAWKLEHDSYLAILEEYLTLAASHGISVLITLSNDCSVKKENIRMPTPGPQPIAWGHHGGTRNSAMVEWRPGDVGYNPQLDEPEGLAELEAMVTEIVTRYAQDERVLAWDVMNEPGNSNRDLLTAEPLRRLFAAVRRCDPIQPVTADVWSPGGSAVETLAAELSDVISFHDYRPLADFAVAVRKWQRYGRPLLCTEWLSRISHSTVFDIFPILYLERIGCYNWGFVNGLSQMNEPHEAVWTILEREGAACTLDPVPWMHDLYRPSLRPYDPKEIALIRRLCRQADTEDGVPVKNE